MSATDMVSVTVATGILDAIAEAGGRAERVLRNAGVERSTLLRRDGLMRSSAFSRLLEESARSTGDSCFGLHFGVRFDPKDIGILAYVIVNSPTVAAAMRNIERYLHLHNHAPRVSFSIEGKRGYLRYLLKSSENALIRQHNEYSMAVLVKTLRAAAGEAWMPGEIQFAHKRGAACNYEDIFGPRVCFGCATNALVVDRGFIECCVAGADHKLYRALRRHLDRALAGTQPEDVLLESIRSAIAPSLECGDVKLERIAAKLAMNARTLERRLKAHGVVYRDLLADARRRLALEYLKDKQRTITEIAFLLGYSEVSAFTRAFKRWTGSTPHESRARPS
ncbi:MAG: AraC family transcriptional regulator [Burkholderiales bacterium]